LQAKKKIGGEGGSTGKKKERLYPKKIRQAREGSFKKEKGGRVGASIGEQEYSVKGRANNERAPKKT